MSLALLIAYDAAGNVVATLDYLRVKKPDGSYVLVDPEEHERSGRRLRELWQVESAVGSGSWPEWIGPRAHDFRVELDSSQPLKIKRLVHRASGLRRERSEIEREVARRRRAAGSDPVDLRDLLGGPGRPLELDDDGRSKRERKEKDG